MTKSILLTLLCFICDETTFAQKKDTTFYYLKNSGKLVSTRDSAYYLIVVVPADSNLYTVNGYLKTGRLIFATKSLNPGLKFKFQGQLVSFFSNGNKMIVSRFEN